MAARLKLYTTGLAALGATVFLGTAMTSPSVTADPIPSIVIDTDPECTIEDQSVLLDADDGRNVDLDVLVLLDGVTASHAASIFADVATPYAELGVTVVPTYQVADPFVGTSAADIIRQAKLRFTDKKVPADYDIVEVLTSKDITGSVGAGVAGLADCIGGVANKARAFEVSEAGAPPSSGSSASSAEVAGPQVPAGPAIGGKKMAAKVSAHEMGHLLGAQHHYANCLEGIDPATELSDFGPCTLMFNEATALSLHFSTANAAIARGYALRYASTNDA